MKESINRLVYVLALVVAIILVLQGNGSPMALLTALVIPYTGARIIEKVIKG